MSTVHGLKIDLWIPIAVIEDYNVGGCQVDTKTSGSRTQQKGKLLRTILVEFVHLRVASFTASVSVNSTVFVANEAEVILQNIKHTSHLAENQHSRTLFLELNQKLVKEHHLPSVLPDMGPILVRRTFLGPIKEIWMVANLSQLHEHVQQANSIRATQFVELMGIFGEDLDIPFLLHFGETNVELGFLLGRKRGCHVLFDPTQHEWPQNRVQLFDDILFSVLIRETEPFIKLLSIPKYIRHEEIEKRPKFPQIVLQRGSSNEETVLSIHSSNNATETTVFVLDTMGFINDEIPPLDSAKLSFLSQ
mmetsp:Transcript_73672/g.206831  ORF Transcript_73672/g.206831 Transcript_73672/m.206831 type:complete len:305 (+) Transcript_73672:1639-2553(+)